MGAAGPYTACSLLARYGYGERLEAAVMGLYGPINDKPPLVGSEGLTRLGGSLTLKLQFERDASLTDCSSPVNHPTTPRHSGMLVGETTRSITLNLHRGGQPVGARRQSGSANGT